MRGRNSERDAFVESLNPRFVVGLNGAAGARIGPAKESDMRFVMFTFNSPEGISAWEAMAPEEQAADVERHREWFRRYGEKIAGGEELDEPGMVKTLRPGRQGEGVVVTDGPFVETKEILGGFVILEADSMDEAVAMASEWPAFGRYRGVTVQVQPVFVRE